MVPMKFCSTGLGHAAEFHGDHFCADYSRRLLLPKTAIVAENGDCPVTIVANVDRAFYNAMRLCRVDANRGKTRRTRAVRLLQSRTLSPSHGTSTILFKF